MIVTGPPGFVAVPSALVLTLKLGAMIAAAPRELVSPLIVSEAAVLLARLHAPPLSARVIVTVAVAWVPTPAALQFVKPAPSTIVGEVGTVKFWGAVLGKTTVTVLDPTALVSAPAELVVNPTVQFAVAPATIDEPTKVTEPTEGSIRYGTGSDESSSRSSSRSTPPRCVSDQRRPFGVTGRPCSSSSSTGVTRRPVSRPPAPRNAIMPSFRRVGTRPAASSRQLQVRSPWCWSTWSSSSAPVPVTVTNSWP